MKTRIPSWVSGAKVFMNNQQQFITTTPGSYTAISRIWDSGDTATVKLPMRPRLAVANDNKNLVAVAYGPTVLSSKNGSTAPSSSPTLTLSSLRRTSGPSMDLTGTADGATVQR
ncbi:hypothetical protein F4825DRAFT_227866 [Nemania diffusa]|nr:hypothetical protein F4825DRAFT_227866 [Nemania diffusa]